MLFKPWFDIKTKQKQKKSPEYFSNTMCK